MTRLACKGCRYHRTFSPYWSSVKCCHFCLDTGELRGCPAGKGCVRYEQGSPPKRSNGFLFEEKEDLT